MDAFEASTEGNTMANVVHLRNSTSIEEHAERICMLWDELGSNYVEGIVKIGRELKAAQTAHGDASFRKLEKHLPFKYNWISVFISVSENPVLLNEKHRIKCPPDYNTLGILNQLPEEIMLQAIKDGRIHRNMTRADAQSLLPPKAERRKEKPISARVRVLDLYKRTHRGMTVDAVRVEIPDIHAQTVNSAVSQLVKDGFLVDTGKRAKTRSDGGRLAIVYKYQKNRPQESTELTEFELEEQEVLDHEIDPKNYYKAFLIRADQARVFAFYSHAKEGVITSKAMRENIIAQCRKVVSAWEELIQKMETES